MPQNLRQLLMNPIQPFSFDIMSIWQPGSDQISLQNVVASCVPDYFLHALHVHSVLSINSSGCC